MKAEGVCRLLLPGVRTCLPFEEGGLHSLEGKGGGGAMREYGWLGAAQPEEESHTHTTSAAAGCCCAVGRCWSRRCKRFAGLVRGPKGRAESGAVACATAHPHTRALCRAGHELRVPTCSGTPGPVLHFPHRWWWAPSTTLGNDCVCSRPQTPVPTLARDLAGLQSHAAGDESPVAGTSVVRSAFGRSRGRVKAAWHCGPRVGPPSGKGPNLRKPRSPPRATLRYPGAATVARGATHGRAEMESR